MSSSTTGGIRRQGVGAHQRRNQSRRESLPRQPVRVHAQRRIRLTQFLHASRPGGPAAHPEPVRRGARRAHRDQSRGATESETNLPQNVDNIFDESGEWAHSSFDHRHQFIASATYQTPSFGEGIATTILSGWRANTIVIAQSGAPFTVNLGVDRANIGAGPAQRPDQSCNPNDGGARNETQWFDTSSFALPAPFTFGTAPRNSVLGPDYVNVDLSLARTWKIRDSQELGFRWEVFNLFDRVNFDLPNRTFGNANFGRVFSAKAPREMQFGVRFAF
jgi:hypothetical protein